MWMAALRGRALCAEADAEVANLPARVGVFLQQKYQHMGIFQFTHPGNAKGIGGKNACETRDARVKT